MKFVSITPAAIFNEANLQRLQSRGENPAECTAAVHNTHSHFSLTVVVAHEFVLFKIFFNLCHVRRFSSLKSLIVL
jgi:hypothetical protein